MTHAAPRRLTVTSEISIPYIDHGPMTGAPVVLIHGLGDSLHSYDLVLAHLPDDVRALVPTLRGHGDADRPADGYSPANFATDLAVVLDDAGAESAVLVGHSSGSQVALQFAITYPQRTQGLVLVGAPGAIRDHPGRAEFDRAFSTIADPIDPAFVRAFQQSLVARALPDAFLDTLVAESLKAPARVIRATWAGISEFDLADDLTRITAPTLLVWGDKDPVSVASREAQDWLLAAIPDARLSVYEGVGHSPHWEDPVRFAADLASFSRAVRT